MATDRPNNPTAPNQVLRARDPLYRELYSNVSQTQLGPYDITILFQKTSEITLGQMGVVDQAAVTFSPQHFKALVKSLQATLDGYEAAFGKLTINEADTTPTKSAAQIAEMIAAGRVSGAMPSLSSTEQPPPSEQSHAVSRKTEKRP